MSYACLICGKGFESYQRLKRHARQCFYRRAGGRCPVCVKRFRNVLQHCAMMARNGCAQHQLLWVLVRGTKHTNKFVCFERRRELDRWAKARLEKGG